MLRIAVLVSGGGTNLQAIIDNIEQGNINNAEIAVVISNNSNAYAIERANKHRINTQCISPKNYISKDAYDKDLIKCLEDNRVDLIVLAGFLVVLSESVIRRYKNKIINVHPSLLPSFSGKGYYGLKVHEAAIQRGVQYSGATVHFVDEGTDTGPIILQKVIKVNYDDTPTSLQKRVMEEAEWDILPKAIQLIANKRIEVVDNKVKLLAEEE